MRRQERPTIGPAIVVPAAILAALGCWLRPAWGNARGRPPRSRARIVRVIDLPGYSGLTDPNGRTVYLVHDTSQTSDEIVAFDWRRRRIRWRTPDEGLLWPVGVSPSCLILANYAQGGPETFGPLAGLDRRTGRTLWWQSNEAVREGANGISVVGNRILEALPGKLVCMSAASGQEICARDLGSQMAGPNWPYPPAEAAGSVIVQVVTAETRVVALDSRNGQTRWSHAFPWTVFFEGGTGVRRVGPQAAMDNSVVALIPTGPQTGEPGGPTMYAPPCALYCWDARTGRLRWRQSAPWTDDPLIVSHGVVMILPRVTEKLREPGLIAFSMASGRQSWHLGGRLFDLPPPAGMERREVVLYQSGKTGDRLLSIDPVSGHLKWDLRLPLPADVRTVLSAGRPGLFIALAEDHPGITGWRSRLYVISTVGRRHRLGHRGRRKTGTWRRSAVVPGSR